MPVKDPHHIEWPKRGWFGLKRLVLKGFWEIPEVMGSSGLALIGMTLAYIGCRNYIKNDGERREYRSVYVVVRDTDPKAKQIRNPVYTKWPLEEEEWKKALEGKK